MPRTVSKVDSLLEDDASMESALARVLEAAEENGVISWSDVSDDLTSGQWGRLIEKDILVDADGEGFVVDDPDGVREAIDADVAPGSATSSDDEEDDDGSWSVYDKVAALAAFGMLSGYYFDSIRNSVGSVLNVFFGPLNGLVPFYMVVLVLAVLTGLVSAIFQDQLTSMANMDGYKEEQERLKEREKKAKEEGNDEELEEIRKEQMELMSENFGMMKQQFRSMPWIMLFTIPAFLWLYWQVLDQGVGVAGSVIEMPIFGTFQAWDAGVVGPMQAWIIWYIVCSIALSQLIRKALDVQTSPT
jgi:uncharacterized membrane protein (DUF106 family)